MARGVLARLWRTVYSRHLAGEGAVRKGLDLEGNLSPGLMSPMSFSPTLALTRKTLRSAATRKSGVVSAATVWPASIFRATTTPSIGEIIFVSARLIRDVFSAAWR